MCSIMFSCNLCEREFTRQYNLDRHINSIHISSKMNKKIKIYIRECCNKKFTRSDKK